MSTCVDPLTAGAVTGAVSHLAAIQTSELTEFAAMADALERIADPIPGLRGRVVRWMVAKHRTRARVVPTFDSGDGVIREVFQDGGALMLAIEPIPPAAIVVTPARMCVLAPPGGK